MKGNIPTIIIEHRTLLREGLAELLQDTCYKVVASIASVSEIPDLKLSPGRSLLTLLGMLRGRDETLRAVQGVRHAVKVAKLVAVGERLGDDHDFQELLSSGVDAIVFNVSSSDALLMALDLTLVGQEVVILGRLPEQKASRLTTAVRIPKLGRSVSTIHAKLGRGRWRSRERRDN